MLATVFKTRFLSKMFRRIYIVAKKNRKMPISSHIIDNHEEIIDQK